MRAAHTPGPWNLRSEYGHLWIDNEQGRPVIRQSCHQFDDMPADVQRREADFRLMAAAPELLKEIEQLTEQLEHIPEGASQNYPTILFRPWDRVRLRALINKARGGQ